MMWSMMCGTSGFTSGRPTGRAFIYLNAIFWKRFVFQVYRASLRAKEQDNLSWFCFILLADFDQKDLKQTIKRLWSNKSQGKIYQGQLVKAHEACSI